MESKIYRGPVCPSACHPSISQIRCCLISLLFFWRRWRKHLPCPLEVRSPSSLSDRTIRSAYMICSSAAAEGHLRIRPLDTPIYRKPNTSVEISRPRHIGIRHGEFGELLRAAERAGRANAGRYWTETHQEGIISILGLKRVRHLVNQQSHKGLPQ